MRPLVLLHVALLRERLSAEAARVRLVAAVHPEMGVQVGRQREALPTQLATADPELGIVQL